MAPLRVVTSQEGPRLTVNALVKDPLLIPQRIIRLSPQQFTADKTLPPAGNAQGGAVQYWESSPLYSEDDAEIVNEFAEVPVVSAQVGEPKTERTRDRALALRV